MDKTKKESIFWGHKSQDCSLKSGRFWLHIFKICINPEWNFGKDLLTFGFKCKLDFDEVWGIQFSINLIFAHFYLTIEDILTKEYCRKKIIDQNISCLKIIDFKVFQDLICWSFFLSEDLCHTWYPKNSIKDGTFNYINFILGKAEYSEKTLQEQDIKLEMPEKIYNGTGRLFNGYWKRSRWITKVITRCEVNFPEGVPHPGKGTCAHNCDDTSTFSLTASTDNILECIQKFKNDIMYMRKKYPL